jgi:hypothetical protein
MLQICELLQDNRQWLENLQVLLAELRFQNEWFLVNFKGSQLNWCCTNQRRLRKHYQGWLQLPMLQVYSRKVDHSSPSDAGSVSIQSQSVHSFKSLSLGILFWTVWMIYVLFPFPSDFETPACPSMFIGAMPNTRDMQYTFLSFSRRMLLGTYKWNRVAHKMIQLWDYLDFMHCMGSVGIWAQ